MENFEKYKEYTNSRNWKSLSALNEIELDSFGTKKELKLLHEYLEPNEVVFALANGLMSQTVTSNASDLGLNTWLVVLTSERFLFIDAALLSKSVDTQSVRHDKVQAVSASQGWIFGKIVVDIGSRMITVDNCLKAHVKVMADLANKWLRELNEKNTLGLASSVNQESLLDKLVKLAGLKDSGMITVEEFDKLKAKILSDL